MADTQNNTQTKPTFDPSIPKRAYTASEWKQKEDWYVSQCTSIPIPDAPNPADVQYIISRIDSVLTVARLDYAFVEQALETYSQSLKIEEKRLFVDVKVNIPTPYNALKLTESETKGIVTSTILKNPWGKTGCDLYTLVKNSTLRNVFMENIINILEDKKNSLVTHSGMLKIENSLNSLQNSSTKKAGYHG
jgi:hypothetical protein